MVIDSTKRFAERTATMLIDLAYKLKAEGVEDPSAELDERLSLFASDSYDEQVFDIVNSRRVA